jgi:hypothetical protein
MRGVRLEWYTAGYRPDLIKLQPPIAYRISGFTCPSHHPAYQPRAGSRMISCLPIGPMFSIPSGDCRHFATGRRCPREQEFGRLRKTYEQHAGPQWGADRFRFGNGARARWNSFLFLLGNRGVPLGRWSDFRRFPGQGSLNVRTKYALWHIVPASLRPSTQLFIEVHGYGGHSQC